VEMVFLLFLIDFADIKRLLHNIQNNYQQPNCLFMLA
jgi:hypothetical protein